MENSYSIIEVESAINFWRLQDRYKEENGLSARVSVLANLYGHMIFDQRASVSSSALSDAQRDALLIALNQERMLP